MAPHSSILAWKIPWTEEPGRLQSSGLQRVGHDWAHTHLGIRKFVKVSYKGQAEMSALGKGKQLLGVQPALPGVFPGEGEGPSVSLSALSTWFRNCCLPAALELLLSPKPPLNRRARVFEETQDWSIQFTSVDILHYKGQLSEAFCSFAVFFSVDSGPLTPGNLRAPCRVLEYAYHKHTLYFT